MADRIAYTFENFLTLSVDIRERLHERLVNELDDASKATRIAALIDERVRLVRCDPRLRKFEPRPSGRTASTRSHGTAATTDPDYRRSAVKEEDSTHGSR